MWGGEVLEDMKVGSTQRHFQTITIQKIHSNQSNNILKIYKG